MAQAAAKQTVPDPQPTKISYDEFLERYMDGEHLEWVNGEVVPMSPISDKHNELGGFLLRLIGEFVEAHQSGVIRYEPFQMKTGPDLPGRSPDVLFVATENLGRLQQTHLRGPADLVIEIISPESRERDRVTKFAEYEQGGVREYWILDPDRKEAEFYRRGTDGKYQAAILEDERIYQSEVLSGLWINVEWLWQRPHPTLREIRKQWGML